MNSCDATCCACNAENEVSVAQVTRDRNFCISGNINIHETISATDCAKQIEESKGESHKSSTCVTSNSGGSGAPPSGGCVTACLGQW